MPFDWISGTRMSQSQPPTAKSSSRRESNARVEQPFLKTPEELRFSPILIVVVSSLIDLPRNLLGRAVRSAAIAEYSRGSSSRIEPTPAADGDQAFCLNSICWNAKAVNPSIAAEKATRTTIAVVAEISVG